MSYAIKLVQFNGTVYGLVLTNIVMFPRTPFPYFLHSSWHCNPTPSAVGNINVSFGSVDFFTVFVLNGNGVAPYCEVTLSNLGHAFYDAHFALPPNQQWHVLVSVNCNTQVVQVYCNDQACAFLSGGFTASGQMQEGGNPIIALDVGALSGTYPSVADLWEANTPSFVDLSVTANRRKFINSDLTPVDLGPNGANPFGSQPPIFLVAKTSPDDFTTNYGSGGGPFLINGEPSMTLSYQALGLCPRPPPPPPPPPTPPPVWTGIPPYLREMTYRQRLLGASFDPTVVITKLRPGPLRIIEIDSWMN